MPTSRSHFRAADPLRASPVGNAQVVRRGLTLALLFGAVLLAAAMIAAARLSPAGAAPTPDPTLSAGGGVTVAVTVTGNPAPATTDNNPTNTRARDGVSGESSDQTPLASTGEDLRTPAEVAIVLLGAGGLLLIVGRRRTTRLGAHE